MAMDLATVDHLLTTTRSVRKRLDLTRPVARDVIERCLEIAIQAPTGSNRQNWHFMVVTDAERRARLGKLYRQSFAIYRGPQPEATAQTPRSPRARQMHRVMDSASYLAEHLHEVPVLVIPCIRGRVEDLSPMELAGLYGSILPAAWSLMLALRARGLGSAWTTLHLRYEAQAAELLAIPPNITQVALLPVAYYTGDDFRPARRKSPAAFTYWNEWGQSE